MAKSNYKHILEIVNKRNKVEYYKNPRHCKNCKNIIPYGSYGKKYCSDKCRPKQLLGCLKKQRFEYNEGKELLKLPIDKILEKVGFFDTQAPQNVESLKYLRGNENGKENIYYKKHKKT